MLKRMQLLPLIFMLWCGGMSLSSGLYFQEINDALYLLPIGLMMGIYYSLRALFRQVERGEFFCFGGSFLLSLLSFSILRTIIIPGFCVIVNTLSYRLNMAYGLALGSLDQKGTGSVELAVCQVIAFVTVLSLYLYEKHLPAAVTALPSFLLFITSIAADGVPYEACTIVYGASLIIFLGMGRRGGNVPQFLLLSACTVVTAVVVASSFSWADVSERMWEYRDQIVTIGGGGGAGLSDDSVPEKERHMINFGQFNKDGDITYNGTIELRIKTEETFGAEKLFLRGFIGTVYHHNEWEGFWMDSDMAAEKADDIFDWDQKIKLENVYDKGLYKPYSVIADQQEELLSRPAGLSSLKGFEDGIWLDTMEMSSQLYDRITEEIIQKKKHKTVKQAINIVKDYFGDGFQYSLSPGKMESGVDEVEKFLFQTKKGYCTHFATSAVLIFRIMGIPARLAEGYMVSGDKIIPDETTDVYDYNAHAWVEIYINREGWMPLDVTSYVLGDLMEQNEWEVEQRQRQRERQKQEHRDQTEKEQEEPTPVSAALGGGMGGFWHPVRNWAKGFFDRTVILSIVLLLIVCGSCAVTAVFLCRRRTYEKIKREMRTGSYGKRLLFVNDRLADFWRETGAPWDYHDSGGLAKKIFWQTKDYYHLLLRTSLEKEKKEQTRRYVLSVYESRFGEEGITAETFLESMAYLLELVDQIRENAEKKKWKKFRKCSMVRVLEKEMERRHERT